MDVDIDVKVHIQVTVRSVWLQVHKLHIEKQELVARRRDLPQDRAIAIKVAMSLFD
jgi:hypothetical protein